MKSMEDFDQRPKSEVKALLLKPGLLELQFEHTEGRKIQDAWVYHLIRAKCFNSSDHHQVACHHGISLGIGLNLFI